MLGGNLGSLLYGDVSVMYIKVGCKGCTLHGHVSMMNIDVYVQQINDKTISIKNRYKEISYPAI